MKKIFVILSFFILPFIALGDLLPEPEILIDEEIAVINDDSENILWTNDYNNIDNDIDNGNIDDELMDYEDINDENIDIVEIDPNGFKDWWMSMIAYWFCNEWFENVTDTLNAAVTQQTPFKVCFIAENYADVDLAINAYLVSTTPDDQWNDVCWLESDFQEFMTSGELWIINIPADNYVVKEFDITFPLWYDWLQKWCLVYSMYREDDDEWGVWLQVVFRKWLPMNFFVGNIDWVKNELSITDLVTNFDDNKDLIMSFYVENIGNMENTFDIQWAVKSLFWYNKNFEITDGQVAPWRSQYVEINLWSLPSYGGKFDIDFTINGTPYFSYDITNANVDPTWLEPKSWDFSTSVFKMPWLILAVAVIFILLLIVLFKKPKQKVIYVQQQHVQPQQVQQPTQQYTQPVQQPVQPVQQPQPPQNPNYPQN